MINDTLQSLLPSIYPILKQSFNLTYTQVGMITLSYQLTASILQPLVGRYTDRHHQPYSLAFGMSISLVGLAFLSQADTYPMILLSSVMIGMGAGVHDRCRQLGFLDLPRLRLPSLRPQEAHAPMGPAHPDPGGLKPTEALGQCAQR